MEHLLWLNWSFTPLIHKKQAISDATDRILEFWLQILNLHENLVLTIYNMSYSGVISSAPFLVIIIVFAPVRITDQIWWCPFQIPHLCEILHLLTYKSSHVEHVIRLPSINLYYFNLLFIGYPKALLMVTSSIIRYSKTLLWHWIYIHVYPFPKLPNLVSPITELTSQLDLHSKSVLNAYTYVPVPWIAKFG